MSKQRLQELAGIRINDLAINKPRLEDRLFDEWKQDEIAVGNNITANSWKELNSEDKSYYLHYVDLVRKYPNANKEDLAVFNSIFLYGGVGGGFYEYEWNDIETIKEVWDNEMDERY